MQHPCTSLCPGDVAKSSSALVLFCFSLSASFTSSGFWISVARETSAAVLLCDLHELCVCLGVYIRKWCATLAILPSFCFRISLPCIFRIFLHGIGLGVHVLVVPLVLLVHGGSFSGLPFCLCLGTGKVELLLHPVLQFLLLDHLLLQHLHSELLEDLGAGVNDLLFSDAACYQSRLGGMLCCPGLFGLFFRLLAAHLQNLLRSIAECHVEVVFGFFGFFGRRSTILQRVEVRKCCLASEVFFALHSLCRLIFCGCSSCLRSEKVLELLLECRRLRCRRCLRLRWRRWLRR